MNDNQHHDLVRKFARDLGEHFDAVQVLVTWNEEGISKDFACGSGNWYARQGLAHEFITKNQSMSIAQEMSNVNLHMAKPPEEEDASTD